MILGCSSGAMGDRRGGCELIICADIYRCYVAMTKEPLPSRPKLRARAARYLPSIPVVSQGRTRSWRRNIWLRSRQHVVEINRPATANYYAISFSARHINYARLHVGETRIRQTAAGVSADAVEDGSFAARFSRFQVAHYRISKYMELIAYCCVREFCFMP